MFDRFSAAYFDLHLHSRPKPVYDRHQTINSEPSKIRVADGSVQGNYAVGSGPSCVVFDGISIWVTNQLSNDVTKLRASDGTHQGTFPVGGSPLGVAFDGANVWIANSGGTTVSKR